ncbi:MAG: right-handed parallel beta-helix repeat-containing protein [Thermoplasmata archaeon]|nr:right-handed parallel beta-helix repeat-containing protein [Thermoplasmata archaeon]
MARRFRAISLALCLQLLLVQVLISEMPESASALTPHSPIYIDGNSGFTAPNGVVSGNGAWDDPFIIEGWEIDAFNAQGIEVRNTDAHFIVRDVSVHSGSFFYNGIYFSNVLNASVGNGTFTSNFNGLFVEQSSNVSIKGNNISTNQNFGVFFLDVDNCTIEYNNVTSHGFSGIASVLSTDIVVKGNNISDNSEGIGFQDSSGYVIDNNITGNGDGIGVRNCADVTIANNSVASNSEFGIWVVDSDVIRIWGNAFSDDGVLLHGSTVSHFNSHTITTDNLVNGAPIYYLKDAAGFAMNAIPAGQVILANCTNGTIANLNLSDADVGIQLGFSDGVSIAGSRFSDNVYGIHMVYSYNVTISGSNITSSSMEGVFSEDSGDITVLGSNMSYNDYGLWARDTHNVTVVGSSFFGNGDGMGIYYSADINITGNILVQNDDDGMDIERINNAVVAGNYVDNGYMGINLYRLHNGTVVGNNASGHSNFGILLSGSDDSLVAGNTVSDSKFGIGVGGSDVTIVGNTISACWQNGIRLLSSANVTVHHNRLMNNAVQAFDDAANSWDNGYPSGGNYWSDYAGVDMQSGPNQDQPGGDGFGDTPYVIDADSKDNYPLVESVGPPQPPALLGAHLSGADSENVTISWSLSPDDGAGLGSVRRYVVLRNMTYDSGGLGYSAVALLPNGTESHVDNLAGEGDPNNYFYLVCAVDAVNNSACSEDQAGKFTRPLSVGPNLVSIPLIQSSESVGTVLQTVAFDAAWAYEAFDDNDSWRWHMPFKPYGGDLAQINHTSGVWVNVVAISNLTVAGIVPLQTNISLRAGWNLVGFPSYDETFALADLKAAIPVLRAEGFDGLAPPSFLRVLSDSEFLSSGFGYWVKVDGDTSWDVLW